MSAAQQGGGELPQDEPYGWALVTPLHTHFETGKMNPYKDGMGAFPLYARPQAALAQRAASVPAQAGITRAGLEQAAKALHERAQGWHKQGNYTRRDECLQCESMLNDMKPAASPVPAASVQPDIGRDAALDQVMKERDYNEAFADQLANCIADYFGVDIGEHSSANCPWTEAVRVIEDAPSLATQPAPEVASVQPVAVPEGWVLSTPLNDFYERGELNPWKEGAGAFPVYRAAPSAPAVQVQPVGYVFGNSYWEEGNPRLTDEVRRLGQPRFAAAPAQPADPMDWPLPCDVSVGAGTHKKGVPLRSLVARIKVLHGMAMAQPATKQQRVYQVRHLQSPADWKTIPDAEKHRYLDDPEWEVQIADVPDAAAPNPQDAVDAALLRLVTNPRQWTEAMSNAWHRAIPDVEKAFADLLDAARANKEK